MAVPLGGHVAAASEDPGVDLLRRLAGTMPQIVWTADRDGRATYYNRRWWEYTGQTPDRAAEAGWISSFATLGFGRT